MTVGFLEGMVTGLPDDAEAVENVVERSLNSGIQEEMHEA